MNWKIIGTLIGKDAMLFFRDKFFGIMSIVGLIFYILIYFLMPDSIDEKIEAGFYAPQLSEMLNTEMEIEREGLLIQNMKSEEELKQAVKNRDIVIGIVIPEGIQEAVAEGKETQIRLYYSSDIPDEVKETYTIVLEEMMSEMAGFKPGINTAEIVLGTDMAGKQIAYRNRILILFIFIILIIETMGLANLISSELETGNARALLTTPMKVSELFVGKGITGILLAFIQALLLLLITFSLNNHTLLLLTALLLGSILVTGLAFIIASVSKDMMTVIGWSFLAMILLLIPAFGIMFPGPVSNWIKVIPSYHLIDTVNKAVNYNIGWSECWDNMLILLGFDILVIILGIIILKRRMSVE
jgi:ABC-2 type transport system permease protein